MALYVDGFLLPVPKKNLNAYRRMARECGKIWRKLGALEFRECVGDDLIGPHVIPFPKLVKSKRGEIVMFSWIVYRSRADRDRINARIMKHPRMQKIMAAMNDPKKRVFDCARMSMGGFKVLVDA